MSEAWHESLKNSARNTAYDGFGALKAAAAAERSADESVGIFRHTILQILVLSHRLASQAELMDRNRILLQLPSPLKLCSFIHLNALTLMFQMCGP